MLLKIVILVFQIYIVDSWRQCDDCVIHSACPETISITSYFKTPESLFQLLQGICGLDGNNPKVCCNDFTSPPVIDSRINFVTDVDTSLLHINESTKLLPINCGITSYVKDRIYGGSVAEINEFPWMALISAIIDASDKEEFICGGTIINSKYILTAAHCVADMKLGHVRVGEYNINNEDCSLDGSICEDHYQDLSIEKKIPHESYLSNGNPKMPSFDIALIRVKGEIDFNQDDVAPICLPLNKDRRESNLVGEEGEVAGWGNIETGSQSTVLLKAKIGILNDTLCHGINNTICADGRGKDSCNADSGGPLMIHHLEAGRYVQYGVVSSGNIDCGTGSGTYTDVRKYIDWILDKIEE